MPSRWKWAQEQCMVWERGPWDLCASWTVRWLWVIVMKDDAVFTQGSHYEGTWMLLKGYWILLSRWWGDPKLFRLRRNIIRAEIQGLPRWLSGEESACQCGRCQRHIFNPCVKKSPWRRKWQPTPGFFPGKFHGQRSLTGYSPWGRKESDTSEHACRRILNLWLKALCILSLARLHLTRDKREKPNLWTLGDGISDAQADLGFLIP